jgi:hypothetical protein
VVGCSRLGGPAGSGCLAQAKAGRQASPRPPCGRGWPGPGSLVRAGASTAAGVGPAAPVNLSHPARDGRGGRAAARRPALAQRRQGPSGGGGKAGRDRGHPPSPTAGSSSKTCPATLRATPWGRPCWTASPWPPRSGRGLAPAGAKPGGKWDAACTTPRRRDPHCGQDTVVRADHHRCEGPGCHPGCHRTEPQRSLLLRLEAPRWPRTVRATGYRIRAGRLRVEASHVPGTDAKRSR